MYMHTLSDQTDALRRILRRAQTVTADTFVVTFTPRRKANAPRAAITAVPPPAPPRVRTRTPSSERSPPRPKGPKGPNKLLLTVRYDPDVVAYFRSTGAGWQSRMNQVLRDYAMRKAVKS